MKNFEVIVWLEVIKLKWTKMKTKSVSHHPPMSHPLTDNIIKLFSHLFKYVYHWMEKRN